MSPSDRYVRHIRIYGQSSSQNAWQFAPHYAIASGNVCPANVGHDMSHVLWARAQSPKKGESCAGSKRLNLCYSPDVHDRNRGHGAALEIAGRVSFLTRCLQGTKCGGSGSASPTSLARNDGIAQLMVSPPCTSRSWMDFSARPWKMLTTPSPSAEASSPGSAPERLNLVAERGILGHAPPQRFPEFGESFGGTGLPGCGAQDRLIGRTSARTSP